MGLGVDIGGTFTDFVLIADGQLQVHKLPSTPDDHARAFLAGLDDLATTATAGPVVHGTTVATNALLERKGAKTALITTKGFKDVLEIGRQHRPDLYALEPRRTPPLVPADLRFEVAERVDYQGAVLTPLDSSGLPEIIAALRREGVESVAVCLLFSFLHPQHEQAIVAAIHPAGFSVSASHLILPEFREYERASTTTVNAYVSPVMERYLSNLQHQLPAELGPLRVMQSNGGTITAEAAKAVAARTVLSGPAAGVVGAAYMAGLSGYTDIISFDMGGTSTDVALVPSRLRETTEATIGGLPVCLPMLDIHTVGAGGGSIARRDAGGALRVGPESAGADPGPACYGKGEHVTVTDAHVVLGRILPEYFLGGRMTLDAARAADLTAGLGETLDLDATKTANGIIQVANTSMEKAIRVISVERGFDPRRFTLVAFGGAGPLHACDLAEALGIPRVLVPLYPGVLSALGMQAADVMKDYSQTVMWQTPEQPDDAFLRQVATGFRELAARGWQEITDEGVPRQQVQVLTAMDMRYTGQSFELTIPFEDLSTGDLTARFHATHSDRFGYSQPGEPVEIVNLRLKLIGRTQRPGLPKATPGPTDASEAVIDRRMVWFNEPHQASIYDRARLHAGHTIAGPAVVTQLDTTTAVPPGWAARVDPIGNLVLERTT